MLSDAKAIRVWLVRHNAHEETGRNGAMGSAANRDFVEQVHESTGMIFGAFTASSRLLLLFLRWK